MPEEARDHGENIVGDKAKSLPLPPPPKPATASKMIPSHMVEVVVPWWTRLCYECDTYLYVTGGYCMNAACPRKQAPDFVVSAINYGS